MEKSLNIQNRISGIRTHKDSSFVFAVKKYRHILSSLSMNLQPKQPYDVGLTRFTAKNAQQQHTRAINSLLLVSPIVMFWKHAVNITINCQNWVKRF